VFQKASIEFSIQELWLIRAVVRHESSPAWQGKWPTYNLELNDQVAEAILLCTDEKQDGASLMVTQGDLYLLDAMVPQDAKDAAGKPIGKDILLKTFRARRELSGGERATAEDPDVAEQRTRLEEWKNLPKSEDAKRPRRTRKAS
jgi:hypothetical protein